MRELIRTAWARRKVDLLAAALVVAVAVPFCFRQVNPLIHPFGEIDEQRAQLAQLQENYVKLARGILTKSQLVQFTKNTEQTRAMQEMGIRMSMQMIAKPSEKDSADESGN